VRVFAVASSFDATAAVNSSRSWLQGVLIAAKQPNGSSGIVGNIVSEEFIVQATQSNGDSWTFPCLDAVSAAAAVRLTRLFLLQIGMWCLVVLY
jgi:hypothetical protein